MPFAENLGNAGAVLNAQYGSTSAPNSNAPLLLDPRQSGPFVYLPAESGNFVSFPHSLPLSMTADVDLRAYVAADDWSPSADQTIVGKWNVAGSYSYRLVLAATGVLRFDWSADGTAILSATSTVPVGFADGAFGWVRVSFDANNGASGRTVTFATSTDGSSWTTLGTPVTQAGTTSMFVSSALVEVGSSGSGSAALLSGRVQVVQVAADLSASDVRLFVDFSDELTTGAESLVPDSSSTIIPAGTQSYPNLGWGGGVLNAYSGSTAGADSNDPTYLAWDGTNYLYLPGVAGNYASAPDSAALDITGDIECVARVSRENWGSGDIVVAAKFTAIGSNDSYAFYTGFTGRMGMRWSPDGTYANSIDKSSGAGNILPAVATSSAATYWLKYQLDVDNGAGGYEVMFYYAADQPTEPTSWTQLGSTVVGGSTTSIAAGNLQLKMGQEGAFTGPVQSSFHRVILRSGIGTGATTVFDADFTTGITSGSQTSFTESSSNAATVTINRSTSGRKAVAVVRPCWLFGTDDYLQVADNDLLDFGASDSFTVMACGRFWNTQGTNDTLVAKKANTTNTTQGWSLSNGSSTALNGQAQIGDGSAGITATSASRTAGTLTTLAAVRNVAADNVTVYTNAVAGTPVTDTTTTTLANSEVMRIGRLSGAGTEYADMELFAVAIWRRALTAAEIAAVSNHLDSTPSAAGAALLTDAVFYIDARQQAVGQINRAQTGRKAVACVDCTWLLGTDDYFEIPSESSFNLTGTEDGTWLIRARRFRTPGTVAGLFTKASSATTGSDGWAITTGASDSESTRAWLGDGSTESVDTVAGDWSALETFVVVRNSGTVTVWRDTTQGTPVVDTTGDLSNTSPTRIGALNGGSFFDGEIEAAAFWRRALTAPEIAAVLSYYGV